MSINAYAQDEFEFPYDDGGYVHSIIITPMGNQIAISGIAVNEDVADWDDLIGWNSPCGRLVLISSWNCENPSGPGGRALAFNYVLQAIFDDGCEGYLAVWVWGDPKNRVVYIPSDKNYYTTKVEIRDRCGNPIRARAIYNGELDQDEPFILYAEVKSNNPDFEFPPYLKGDVYFYGVKESFDLRWKEGGSGRAVYETDPIHSPQLSYEYIGYWWNNLSFILDYKNSPRYNCSVLDIRMNVRNLNFVDNILLSGYQASSVCYPVGSYLTLGTTIDVISPDRPFDCEYLAGEIIVAQDYGLHSWGVLTRGQFTTAPCQTTYQINHQPSSFLTLDFKVKVNAGPERPISGGHQNLTIYHGFSAGQTWLSGLPVTLDIPLIDPDDDENICVHQRTNPQLAVQDRIHYDWHIEPPNGGVFNVVDPTLDYVHFDAQVPGEYQLFSEVSDEPHAPGTGSQSDPITIRIKPTITITSPPEAPDNKFSFDNQSTGQAHIGTYAGTTRNSDLDEQIEWSITDIIGSDPSTTPQNAIGPEIIFTFSGLPENNSQFGPKTITASLHDYIAEVRTNVFVYYDLCVDNHNGGQGGSPNWYNYWSQALAVTDSHTYNGSYPGWGQTICEANGDIRIEIGTMAFWSSGNPPTMHDYIDGFLATNYHEFWHRAHWRHNYTVHGAFYPPAQNDSDGDYICDLDPNPGQPGQYLGGWEALIGTNPQQPNSLEDGANWAESTGSYGYDAVDWAHNGSQWR